MNESLRIVMRALRRGWHSVRCTIERLRGRTVVHYLHIGKTAGTSLKEALRAYNRHRARRYYFAVHDHTFTLRDVPESDFCLFSVRDPVSRFVSGFYSRKRQGLPRTRNPHTPLEALIFERFPHANELAEALSGDLGDRSTAVNGMKAIGHVRTSLWDWFGGRFLLDSEKRKVVGILRQEELERDLHALEEALSLERPLEFPGDSERRHENDYSHLAPLTETAVGNLRVWYRQEYAFLEMLEGEFGLPWVQSVGIDTPVRGS